jgi:hypothetical protein
MRRVPVLLVLAAALALAAPAAAKELSKAELCGPAGCIAINDKDTLRNIPTGGETIAAQPPLQSFHTLRLTVTEGEGGPEHTWSVYYVDRAAMLAWLNEGGTIAWTDVRGSAATLMKRLARRVEPFRAPTISATAVGGRTVSADPASYLALFEQTGGRLDYTTMPSDWVPIDFRSATPSPWTDSPFELMYSPSTNAIERATRHIVLPGDLAADIEAARPLAPDGGTRWLPWLVLGGLVVALLLLAGLGALLRHRVSAAPTPEPAA